MYKRQDYGSPTSIEVIYTADGGAMKNEDVSKNAALIPPTFGSPSADTLGTGTYLTPNLAPGGMAVGTITGGNMPVIFPPASDAASGSSGGASTAARYTYVKMCIRDREYSDRGGEILARRTDPPTRPVLVGAAQRRNSCLLYTSFPIWTGTFPPQESAWKMQMNWLGPLRG